MSAAREPYRSKEEANQKYVRAAWVRHKEGIRDIQKRDRCSGGMPSYLYTNKEYEAAEADFREVTMRAWSQLTADNRLHALKIAQDECDGCPNLLEDLHELLVHGSVKESQLLGQDNEMADAEAVINRLERLYKGKKLLRRQEGKERHAADQAAKKGKRKRDEPDSPYNSDDWEVHTDDEEWEDAKYPLYA